MVRLIFSAITQWLVSSTPSLLMLHLSPCPLTRAFMCDFQRTLARHPVSLKAASGFAYGFAFGLCRAMLRIAPHGKTVSPYG